MRWSVAPLRGGADMSRHKKVDVFDFVRDLRNTTIDKSINERARAEDPMADDIPDADSSGRARTERWQGNALIDLHLPGFKTSSGHEQAALTAKVLATTMKSASVMVDLTGPVLEWLKHACTITWMDDAESPPRDNKARLMTRHLSSQEFSGLRTSTS